MGYRLFAPALLLAIFAGSAISAERATVTGRVIDADGKPVEHATVLVYEARVRTGYSVYCPTCWVDCGKRTVTGADGTFSIAGLDSDLVLQRLHVDRFDFLSRPFAEEVDEYGVQSSVLGNPEWKSGSRRS